MNDQDKKTEETRRLLRQKLEGLPPDDDGWNVPSSDVWSGLAAGLGPKKAARRNHGWWLVALALLAILLMRECSHRQQSAALRTEMESLQQAYQKLQETCATQRAQPDASPQAPAKEQQPSPAPSPFSLSSKGAIGHGRPASGPALALPDPTLSLVAYPEDQVAQIAISSPTTTDRPSPEDAAADPRINTTTPGPLPALPFPAINDPVPDLRLPEAVRDGDRSLAFTASLMAGAALTGNRLTGPKPSIIHDQKPLFAYRTGLGLEARLSRHWSVRSGLQYTLSRIRTDYKLQVPFTHVNEFQHDDGNFDNQYNHSLPSALGNYPARFVLTRANSATVGEGELMDLDLSIRQHTRFLSLPLQIRYASAVNKRWQAGAQAGFIANQAIGVATEGPPTVVSHHSAIHQRHTSVGNPSLQELQKTSFDLCIGLDARYELSPRWGFSLETGYQRAVTPLYKNGAVKNYLWAANFGLGLHYQLGKGRSNTR